MLYKKATNLLEIANSALELGVTGAALLLASAAGVGTVAGKVAAKATERNPADLDAVQQQYMSARLDADINQTAAKLRQEQQNRRERQAGLARSSIRF